MRQGSNRKAEEGRKETNGQNNRIRINRYLAMCGVCSRREADELIRAGRVSVDGDRAEPGRQVTGNEDVRVDGRRVHPEEREVVLAVNKPAGVVCSTDRRWGDVLIGDIVQARGGERLFYMGRLDRDSEGLLLLTNQGKLCDEVMRGRNRHEKEYEVTVDRPVTDAFIRQMEAGVFLPELNVTTRPCRVRLVSGKSASGKNGSGKNASAENASGKNVSGKNASGENGSGKNASGEQDAVPAPGGGCVFRIVLTQGLNRQIRRMCQALGYRVLRLRRIRIMNITLGDLKSGQSRELTDKEIMGLRG